jgi:enoyl-CoA hydratase/carnithine racemase
LDVQYLAFELTLEDCIKYPLAGRDSVEAMVVEVPVQYDLADGIATLTLNRPDRLNAWTPAMSELFCELLDRVERDTSVRVVILTGAGRGFCAGADSERLQSIASESSASSDSAALFRRRCFELPKPVIAVINGPCAGVGLVWALDCDVRFAATGAKLTTSFARRGLPAENGISWLLPRVIGLSRALDLLLSGRVVLAEEAKELGLVDWVLQPDELMPAARRYARDLADNCSPRSMASIKSQIYRDLSTDLSEAITESRALAHNAIASADFREGVASFLERRTPRFAPLPADDRPRGS